MSAEYEQLREAYGAAECALGQVEVIVGALPTSVLNEIRYAGSHVVLYLLETDAEKKEEQFRKALSHCQRAYFDAQSVVFLNVYARVKNIREGLGVYLHLFPELVGAQEYNRIKTPLFAASRFLHEFNEIKTNRHKWEDRDKLYRKCEPHITACRDYIHLYEVHCEELCAKVDAARRADRLAEEALSTSKEGVASSHKAFTWAIVGVIIALIIGITSIIMQLCR